MIPHRLLPPCFLHDPRPAVEQCSGESGWCDVTGLSNGGG